MSWERWGSGRDLIRGTCQLAACSFVKWRRTLIWQVCGSQIEPSTSIMRTFRLIEEKLNILYNVFTFFRPNGMPFSRNLRVDCCWLYDRPQHHHHIIIIIIIIIIMWLKAGSFLFLSSASRKFFMNATNVSEMKFLLSLLEKSLNLCQYLIYQVNNSGNVDRSW